MTLRNPFLAAIALLLGVTSFGQLAAAADALPEPGPQNGGLRLRWTVTPRTGMKSEGYEVRVDILNVSAKPINLFTDWERDNEGDVKKYLTGMLAIESYPAFMPPRGGTSAVELTAKPNQSTLRLMAGETLTLRWQASGRTLKPTSSGSIFVENPTFRLAGLYSVHARVNVRTDNGEVPLRSNEQLVPIGGALTMPKHTFGRLQSVNAKEKTASLGLGSQQQVQVGDRFDITSKSYAWRLTITEVDSRYSEGKLEPLSTDPQPTPERGAEAELEQAP